MLSEANVEAAVETASTPRHIALVRITHWIVVLSVLGLLSTGTGILVSHPRLYWGETGGVGTPSLIDLPIPFIIGPSVWNRPFHFLFAWVLVLTGLTYMVGSFITQHFRKDLLPAKAELRWNRMVGVALEHFAAKRKRESAEPQDLARPDAAGATYDVVQRLTDLAAGYGLFPAV